jgi:hypothetical protein
MEGGPIRAIDRRTAGKAAVAIGVFLIAAAILGPGMVTKPSASPGSTSTPSLPVAVAPTATAEPSAEPSAEPWTDLTVGPYAATAALVADDQDRIGVAPGTSFTLRSLTATPAVELARGLTVVPPIPLKIEAGATPDVAHVHALSPLVGGQRYRVRLTSPDGSLAGTWAFVARAPLHVVGTLPGDKAIAVPTNTGIEMTFDQDGVLGTADHFAITPAVAGRFETHGRVWTFVPDKPLAIGTIYTVSVRKGIGLSGSTELLESDSTFRFETALISAADQGPRVEFQRAMVEIRPDDRLTVNASVDENDHEAATPATIGVQIHQLPDFKAVIAAGTALVGPDSWAIAAPSATISTVGMTKVADVTAQLVASDSGVIMTIPVRLAQGAYVATIQQPGAPSQLLIQVTNLSAYALAASQGSVVWVNNLSTDASVAGATVSTIDGHVLGATGDDGLLRTPTPAPHATATAADDFLAIDAPGLGRLLIPEMLSSAYRTAADQATSWYGAGSATWWLLYATDRTTYRQTDTIHVYGTIRARSDRSVPSALELRLLPSNGSPDAPILRVPVKATSRGVFTADVKLDDLPIAQYTIDLYANGNLVSSAWFWVGSILKPAYQIDVTADRHSYLVGDAIHVSTTTSFYDGTPVPGMELDFRSGNQDKSVITDALGHADAVFTAVADGEPEGVSGMSIGVAPVHPEEGQIGGSAEVLVARSLDWVKAQGTVTGGNIVVTGSLASFDLAAFEAALAGGTFLDDPSGAPIVGGVVRASVTHLIETRTQNGTTYDFVEKKVVPSYDYTQTKVSLGTHALTSGPGGALRLSLPAPVAADTYHIVLSAVDAAGRTIQLTLDVSAPSPRDAALSAYLEVPGSGCGFAQSVQRSLDTPVSLTMHRGDGSTATGGRFLFVVGETGSLETTIQDSATFVRTLREADLPGFTARAVWLNGSGYRVADVAVNVDPKDKTLTIRLKPDQASYQPGDQVSIGVITTDPAGRPVAADVVITGVDQKLYTLGQAFDLDPLDQLLAQPGSGFGAAYDSHAVPVPDYGGCGDTGGGRDDFRDSVTFQRITTDASGHGTISFKLSDDLTSWHMAAVGVSAALDAGHASVLVPVGLPFFVDATLAPEYLVGDVPILRLRGYGAGVGAGDPVSFVVSAPTLGLGPTTVRGTAFEALRLPLPAMTAGDHAIRIEASATHAGKALGDILVRTVHVVDSRLGTVAASYDSLGPDFRPQGGDGLTTYVVTDAGRGRLIAPLQELASSTSARFDRTAAAELARTLLIQEFSVAASSLATTGFDASRYQTDTGIALLPYASTDLFLTARAALVAGSLVDVDAIRQTLSTELGPDTTSTRERRIVALAGLAGIGDDVLVQLRAVDQSVLTVREQLWLALGFAAAGDEATARSIERSVLDASGQRLGAWVRLAVGTSRNDTLEASGLLLLLAGRLGDPIGADVYTYLVEQPSADQVFPLEELGYVQGVLDRLPRTAARFAWTVAGDRHVVTLDPGGAFSLVLTPGQRAGLRLEPLDGQLAVATTWIATGGALPSDPSITVTRTVSPSGEATQDRLVRVMLFVTFGAQAPNGCYRLTDLLPSGLAPVVAGAGWGQGEDDTGIIGPYEIEGQRVSWCASPSDKIHTYGYSARVVTPGTYRWEPAVVQFEAASSVGSSTPATTFTIR